MAPFNIEKKVWDSIKDGDSDYIRNLITNDVAVFIDGQRIMGSKLANTINSLKLHSYTIELFEVVLSEDFIDDNSEEENFIKGGSLYQAFYYVDMDIIEDDASHKNNKIYISTTWRVTNSTENIMCVIIQKMNS